MLIANPGHTPYTLISKKPCHNKPARNNAVVGSGSSTKYTPANSATITSSSSAVTQKTMTAVSAISDNNEPNALKTLSVRITRETDLFKHTVQKALISKIPSHFSSVLSLYTVPPTNTHRFPERTESLSVDSLRSEMCHFKPIRTVPTTPSKRSKAVTLKTPKAKLALKQEQNCVKNEKSKPSSNLSETISWYRPRPSAFSYVGLIDSSAHSKKENKLKNKSASSTSKKNEEDSPTEKCANLRVLVKDISPLTNSSEKEVFTTPTSVKHRTRSIAKTLPAASIVEPQNKKILAAVKTRLTRKRQQQILRVEDSVPTKNARLIKDCSKPIKNGKNQDANTGRRRPTRRTPPVTRSRLKQSMIHTRKQYQIK